MDFLELCWGELVAFLRMGKLLSLIRSGDSSWLFTFAGVAAILTVALSGVYLFEIGSALVTGRFKRRNFVPQFLAYSVNRLLSALVFLGTTIFWMKVFEPYQFIRMPTTWYGILYGLIMWDLGVWVCHWASHKVRILWCVHAPHHTSQTMNIGVATGNFLLESTYLSFFRVLIAMLLGVTPATLLVVFVIDGLWVRFCHISEEVLKNGRLGWLNYVLITPSLHRVHHARNPRYLDMNYANVISLWDRIFGTFHLEEPHEKIEYGITRPINVGNFWQYYFGECVALWHDVANAPTWSAKLHYLIMPPGWSHTGDHKTTEAVRRQHLYAQ